MRMARFEIADGTEKTIMPTRIICTATAMADFTWVTWLMDNENETRSDRVKGSVKEVTDEIDIALCSEASDEATAAYRLRWSSGVEEIARRKKAYQETGRIPEWDK